jgi:exodeoxyribonuclease VII large subunit
MLKESYVLRQPFNIITQYEQRIDDLKKEISIRTEHMVKMRGENFNLLAHKLEALSPLAILGRGYSITTKLPEGAIIKDAASVKRGDEIETRLGKGKLRSRVEEAG